VSAQEPPVIQDGRKRCEKHPEIDTMVPCLGCGRYFCRICDAPKGAGQMCPACYQSSLDDPKDKDRRGLSGIFRPLSGTLREADLSVEIDGVPLIARPGRSAAAGAGVRNAATAPVRGAASAWKYLVSHFPIVLRDKEHFDGMPELKESWKGLAIAVASGAVLWTLISVFSNHRYWPVAIVIAGGVSLSVAYVMGGRFDPPTALVGVCLALLSLVIGDLLIQLLVYLKIVGGLDVVKPTFYQLSKPSLYYKNYIFSLFVYRLLPSAALAFLIGWWPLKKRLGWRGFSGETS
jgi:hypothetical protein